MPSPARTLFFALLTSSAIAYAQCPVDTVIVQGRVANPPRDAKVRIQLFYANDQPGPSAETVPENGSFRLPVEFPTQSTRPMLTNLKPKCERKPKTVVISLLARDQEQASVILNFPKDFNESDPTAYAPKSEVVLKPSQ